MTDHAVVIAGGGPTGLMLGAELALAGVDVAIVERRASQELESSRSRGLHSRTIEVLEQRGIAERFIAEGRAVQVQSFGGVALDISDFPSRHPYGLALRQSRFEHILAGWAGELGVPVIREREVTGFTQDDDGVDVALASGGSAPGRLSRRLRRRAQRDPQGGRHRLPRLGSDEELADRRGRDGGRAGLRPARGRWHRPGGAGVDRRRAARAGRRSRRRADPGGSPRGARARRGDGLRGAQPDLRLALHRHDPAGGDLPRRPRPARGRRRARAPAAGRTRSQRRRAGRRQPGLEARPGRARHVARRAARQLLRRAAPRRRPRPPQQHGADRARQRRRPSRGTARLRRGAARHGRATHALRRDDVRPRHPLRPRRGAPAARTADARPRPRHRGGPAADLLLLHAARPVLLDLTGGGGVGGTPWADRVRYVEAICTGGWELPALGAVTAPTAVLIRPDGHVAWVGEDGDAGLAAALTTWFGEPAAA